MRGRVHGTEDGIPDTRRPRGPHRAVAGSVARRARLEAAEARVKSSYWPVSGRSGLVGRCTHKARFVGVNMMYAQHAIIGVVTRLFRYEFDRSSLSRVLRNSSRTSAGSSANMGRLMSTATPEKHPSVQCIRRKASRFGDRADSVQSDLNFLTRLKQRRGAEIVRLPGRNNLAVRAIEAL